MSDERRRPTHTVVVPNQLTMDELIHRLLDQRMTFTVEPGQYGTWHVGLMPEGVAVVTEAFGPVRDVTLDETGSI